ncbi:MAG TPA: prolyl oligopeptidase family serine peptidase [Casimicrobiaceae bacterium]|jgi:dipeptidyl aminopeptidase/acylaminoacyl peptidase|nr:prolyl oligopeptidase family serine peptidase [Casimicrobiaceae bacterium]
MLPLVGLAPLLALGCAALLPVAASATDVVAPEPFFQHDSFQELRLSPSGKYVGALVPSGGRVRLAVIDLETKSFRIAAALDGYDVGWFEWVNDERLVFTAVDLQSGLGEQRGGGLFAANRDGSYFRILAPTLQAQINRWETVYHYTTLLSLLHDASDDILVISNEPDARYPDVYRMNTLTGRKTLESLGKPGDIVSWVVDRKGAVRAAVELERGTITRVFWRPDEEAKWVQLGEFQLREARFEPVAFDGDGTLFVTSNIGRDKGAIYRFDTEKKALGALVAAHPQVDLTGGLAFDREKNKVVGLWYEADRPGAVWFDEDWARLQKAVDAALPGRINLISGQGARALVWSYSDTDPGTYYLFDLEKRRLEYLATRRKAIKPEAMPARQPVHYAARDGLDIPAYLTLPKGKEPKNLPLVLLVHGGPWVHGATWGWSGEPAYLASLGYAVLEPAFRGSTGWGNKLRVAGWKQWGRGMQDDLNDGMDWLVKQGTVDPKRACIMGASYGGYAVMMGLARDPARWRCGINYFGVTDINLMFDITWSDMVYSDYMRYTAKEMMGDPDKDAALLKAVSPIENAAKIKAPVLMAYGAQDRRVPLVHGEKMRDALKAQGTSVEWVVYDDEAHGFMNEKNRYDFYDRVAKFLAQHLGSD